MPVSNFGWIKALTGQSWSWEEQFMDELLPSPTLVIMELERPLLDLGLLANGLKQQDFSHMERYDKWTYKTKNFWPQIQAIYFTSYQVAFVVKILANLCNLEKNEFEIKYFCLKICTMQMEGGWALEWYDPQRTAYTFRGDQWIGYDYIPSIRAKGEYARAQGLGGVLAFAIDMDDFRGSCNEGVSPLVNNLKAAFLGRK
jgi:hypothetical protein